MVVDGVSPSKKGPISSSFDYNSILKFGQTRNIVIFFTLFLLVCYILNSSKPAFISNKVLNEKTHFIEKQISIFKLVLYSFTISIGTIIVLVISYYIYKMKTY